MVRSELNYWKVENSAEFTPDKFPVFIGYESENTKFYGLPIDEYPGLLKASGFTFYCHLVLQYDLGGIICTER